MVLPRLSAALVLALCVLGSLGDPRVSTKNGSIELIVGDPNADVFIVREVDGQTTNMSLFSLLSAANANTQAAVNRAVSQMQAQMDVFQASFALRAAQTDGISSAVTLLAASLGTKADQTQLLGTQEQLSLAIASLATRADSAQVSAQTAALVASLALKANASETSTLLSARPTTTSVQAQLAVLADTLTTKANISDVLALTTSLSLAMNTRANATAVSAALAETQASVALRATTATLQAQIATVTSSLNTKANNSEMLALTASLSTAINTKANTADVNAALANTQASVALRADQASTAASLNTLSLQLNAVSDSASSTATVAATVVSCARANEIFNGSRCVKADIDECALNPCENICTNTPSGYRCSCDGINNNGILNPDGRTCQKLLFTLVPYPTNIRFVATSGCLQILNTFPPSSVPAGATAIVASVTTFSTPNGANNGDHVVHSFGRDSVHTCSTWSGSVFDTNSFLNDVLLTNPGECGVVPCGFYGMNHGTVIIPLKANGAFDSQIAMGYSFGTHYVLIQVYGYLTGQYFLSTATIAANNFRFASAGIAVQTGFNATYVPAGSTGLLGTITNYIPNADHLMFTVGRNSISTASDTASPATVGYIWDNRLYTQDFPSRTYPFNAPMPPVNDLWYTNNGDVAGQHVFGFSFGDEIIPFASGRNVQVQANLGKNSATVSTANTNSLLIQPVGFIPAPEFTNIKFLPPRSVRNILLTYTAQTTLTNIAPPCFVPANTVALITSVYSYTSVNDHQLFSFGRNASHPGNTPSIWSDGAYNANTYLNDVLLSHDGDVNVGSTTANPAYFYGFSHGMQIIPLKPCGTFEALLGIGKNEATTAMFITIQVYGYISATP